MFQAFICVTTKENRPSECALRSNLVIRAVVKWVNELL